MQIKKAEFIKSITQLKDSPKNPIPEFAFIGRSNVGKSSLINMLVKRKQLAKTSGKPGKTQTINFFLINEAWHLVDLPGYGWAKVSKEKKLEWIGFVNNYLMKRENLYCLFILIDIRLDPQAIDLEFINWAGERKIPFALVFTKMDKISLNKARIAVDTYKNVLSKDWDQLPEMFLSSAVNQTGREDIMDFIDSINQS